MIEYVTIRKNAENIDKIKNNTYGICAYRVDDGLIEILNCVYEISDNIVWVKALADKLNQYDVDPVHLNDIIEDELYNIRV